MNKNDNEQSIIDMDCFCKDRCCEGNLSIQPDRINGIEVFMVEVIGSCGEESAYMWISIKQLEQLKEELTVLIEEFEKKKG
jgi:hypothetical protein